MTETIKNLESVFRPKVLKPGKTITRYDIEKNVTAAGENYGSVLLSVDVTIKDDTDGKPEIVRAVAKTVPKNDFIKNFFMSSLTFKKELGFYSTIVPTLRKFQLDHGVESLIDFTADFYGGRLSLNQEMLTADENAVILMENLRAKDYQIFDRMTGFDFDAACLVIKNLALFHAVPLALKLRNPALFKEKIEPYLEFADVFSQSVSEDMKKESIEDILSLAKENPECVPYLDALKKKCEKCYRLHSEAARRMEKEPFATVTHNDLWVNNSMMKLGENGKPIRNKIVSMIDYQFINYGSPGKDLIFFIFNSVKNEIIRTKYNEMIRLYHQTFTTALIQLGVNIRRFSWENFLEELNQAADNTFVICQCFVMLRPIFAVKELATDVENLRNDNILQYKGASVEHKQKLYHLIEEFAKRNWLQ
ncbi:unnamed protein product [Ceutorhynchus assimilis]|uniref:CHK kinase-like domain-containing protein n=1 Tax=Ceutorhynchus assimilis TaxID=467358 RepID=A0A9N9MRV3_9CUCU|nr:unnamed protein product [Ceutorhynchus assimilis]